MWSHFYFYWKISLAACWLVWASLPANNSRQTEVRQARGETTISYTLQHPLHTVNGVSGQVSSQLMLADTSRQLQQVEVRVPVRTFNSGNRARDRDMAEVTEATLYPYVTFTSSKMEEQNGLLLVTGQLTFHGVTQEVTFEAQQKWEGEDLVVDGGFEISLESYKVKRPSLFGMKVKDAVQVRFHMVYPATN